MYNHSKQNKYSKNNTYLPIAPQTLNHMFTTKVETIYLIYMYRLLKVFDKSPLELRNLTVIIESLKLIKPPI